MFTHCFTPTSVTSGSVVYTKLIPGLVAEKWFHLTKGNFSTTDRYVFTNIPGFVAEGVVSNP